MTAYAARAPRRSTVYISQTEVIPVDPSIEHGPTEFKIEARPHPIHAARVWQPTRNGMWHVFFFTIDNPRVWRYADQSAALVAARDLVGRKAGADWKDRFTGSQRYAIGQQHCPKLTNAGTCDQTPVPGSIWCQWHPNGKRVE